MKYVKLQSLGLKLKIQWKVEEAACLLLNKEKNNEYNQVMYRINNENRYCIDDTCVLLCQRDYFKAL